MPERQPCTHTPPDRVWLAGASPVPETVIVSPTATGDAGETVRVAAADGVARAAPAPAAAAGPIAVAVSSPTESRIANVHRAMPASPYSASTCRRAASA